MTLYLFVGLIISYLLGSIPSAVWVGKAFYGKDVRQHGSGNAGATNTFRVLGKRAGSAVLLLDMGKGLLAAYLVPILSNTGLIDPNSHSFWMLMFGFAAIIGHLFPVFAKFRGGKGVATLAGVMLAVHPPLTLVCMLVFLLVLILSKYVSLSSLIATLLFPLMLLLFPEWQKDGYTLVIFGFILFVALLLTHRKNMVRLWKGTENKTYLIKR
jgi:glycerol-3-phosphate acyltransferase PlsY